MKAGIEAAQRIATEVADESASVASRRGPEQARRSVLRRLDAELGRVPASDRGPVACAAGCDLCCHLRVMTTPVEVFGLLDYLRSAFDASWFDGFRARVAAAASRLAGLTRSEVLATNLPCPVLVDGRCAGYAARPLNCRAYHSLARDACERSFDAPGDSSLGHPQYASVARVHEGVQAGFVSGLRGAGFDASEVELVTALAEALDDEDCAARFDRGERAFRRQSPV